MRSGKTIGVTCAGNEEDVLKNLENMKERDKTRLQNNKGGKRKSVL